MLPVWRGSIFAAFITWATFVTKWTSECDRKLHRLVLRALIAISYD
jgi:hypothetical protein